MQGTWPQASYPLPAGAFSPVAPRPGWATTAAIILLISGTFVGLFTFLMLVALLVGLAVAPSGGLSGGSEPLDPAIAEEAGRAVVAMFAVTGLVGGIWTAGHLAAGIGVLKRREWARVLGIILSALGALLFILLCFLVLGSLGMYSDPAFRETLESERDAAVGVSGSGAYGDPIQAALMGTIFGAVFIGLLAVAYLCAVFGLVRSAAYFAWRPAAAPSRSPSPPPWGGP